MVVLLILMVACGGPIEVFSRSGAATQGELNNDVATLRRCASNPSQQTGDLTVDVFQVLDLPLSIHEASLTKTDRGSFLKVSLGNSSDVKIIGLRYSLVSIDAQDHVQPRVNRTEGFSVPAYGTKTLTFKTPIRLKPKDGERFMLMIEQVISRESIWEVVKAKDALEAYARGDYSVVPTVLRVANQVDSPSPERIIRFERK